MLGIVQKQPADKLDYDVDFSRWITDDDEITTVASAVDPDGSLIVDTVSVASPSVKVWLRGGESGKSYKVTLTVSTAFGRIKEVDFRVRVKDV